MKIASKVALGPIYRGTKPIRNRHYLRFVKQFACVACCGTRLVDPAHTGPRGLGTKSDDMQCIPLCRKCHVHFDADPKGFTVRNGLNVVELIRGFNQLWEARQKRIA